MCKQCELNPVYEFTNQRKLCKNCFINYFHKKFLFTIRKYKMIKTGDIAGYKKNDSLKGRILEKMLFFLNKKYGTEIVELPNKRANKIAIDSSLDSEANEIISLIIHGDSFNLKKNLPVEKNFIKPLYLFLDEEILLYAKLRNIKFKPEKKKKEKINEFLEEFEKKHPEVKRAIINSVLGLYKAEI